MPPKKNNKQLEDFYVNAVMGKLPENTTLQAIYQKPKKEPKRLKPKVDVPLEGQTQQADILYLPDDEGYKYCLVVIDLATRALDAQALKSRDNESIIKAFESIYKRKILKFPKFKIECDSEFNTNIIRDYFEKDGKYKNRQGDKVILDIGKVGRHKAQGNAEHRNKVIQKLIFFRQTAQEILTKLQSKEWEEDLPMIVKAINKLYEREEPGMTKAMENTNPKFDGEPLLKVGELVRIPLEEPKDITGKKLHGNFRTGDIRWEMKPRKITDVALIPNQPVMYRVEGIKTTMYTRPNLLLYKETEEKPPTYLQKKFVIEKIIGERKNKNRIEYLVKWSHKEEPTWEPRTSLIKDVPLLIAKRKNKKVWE